MAEWLKAPVSKTGIRIRVSRVRIPLSPPYIHPGWSAAFQFGFEQAAGATGCGCCRGEVPERFNGHAWKACVGASSPQVRILSSPPYLRLALAPGVAFCSGRPRLTWSRAAIALAPGARGGLGRASHFTFPRSLPSRKGRPGVWTFLPSSLT